MAENDFTIESWPLMGTTSESEEIPPARPHDDKWDFNDGSGKLLGTAWVYLSDPAKGLRNPVILSDGFEKGATEIDLLWHLLDRKKFPFVTSVLEQGKDLILLGYEDRSASILRNAEAAIACVLRARDTRLGTAPLVVGGFSMGGIVTRYALAKMEHDGQDHQTGTYISYDSPHRGAWIPISVQAFSHYFKNKAPEASAQLNSDAAKQMLQYHIATHDAPIGTAPERGTFLDALRDVGWWPQQPILLGVANGTGRGVGNGVEAGELALQWSLEGPLGGTLANVTLNAQSQGAEQVVAQLYQLGQAKYARKTSGLPDLDGSPGGTLHTIQLAANALEGAECKVPSICFVPSVSAVAIRDITDHASAYTNINELDPEDSELDAFMCCTSEDTIHTEIIPELATWILKQLE